MTLIILHVKSYDWRQEGGIAKSLLTVMLAAMLAAGATPALAKAPRDAVAGLPCINNDTTLESSSSEENGQPTQSYQNFESQWQVQWTPPRLQLGRATLDTRFVYRTDLLDQSDYLNRVAGPDSSRDSYDLQLDLNTGALLAHHQLSRGDTYHRGDGDQRQVETAQTSVSSLSYNLPYNIVASASDSTSLNYGGPPDLVARGSEQETTTATLRYCPPKLQLGQDLALGTEKFTSSYPKAGTSTDRASQWVDARRELPLANVGVLKWSFSHREDANTTDLGGIGSTATSINESQLVALDGAVRDSPVSYSASFLESTSDYGDAAVREREVSQLRLSLRPKCAPGRDSALDFRTSLERNRQAGTQTDTAALQNTVTWRFSPHRRVNSVVEYQQNRTTDNALGQLNLDRDYVRATVGYDLPGTGGSLNIAAWQDVQGGLQSAYSEDGMEMRNQVTLGKTASVTFKYQARSHADQNNNDVEASAITTNYMTTGVAYDISPAQGLWLHGEWFQDLQLRDADGFRFDGNHVIVDMNYSPVPEWSYSLHLDGDAENSHDLLGLNNRFSNRDTVRAGVSFRF